MYDLYLGFHQGVLGVNRYNLSILVIVLCTYKPCSYQIIVSFVAPFYLYIKFWGERILVPLCLSSFMAIWLYCMMCTMILNAWYLTLDAWYLCWSLRCLILDTYGGVGGTSWDTWYLILAPLGLVYRKCWWHRDTWFLLS